MAVVSAAGPSVSSRASLTAVYEPALAGSSVTPQSDPVAAAENAIGPRVMIRTTE